MLNPLEKMEIVDSFKLERAMFWLYIQLFLLVSIYHALIQGILKIKNYKNKNQDLKNRKTVFLMREEEFN